MTTPTPTTWRTTPACATDAMIEAGVLALRDYGPYLSVRRARIIARAVVDAALKASPPSPLPEPPANGCGVEL